MAVNLQHVKFGPPLFATGFFLQLTNRIIQNCFLPGHNRLATSYIRQEISEPLARLLLLNSQKYAYPLLVPEARVPR